MSLALILLIGHVVVAFYVHIDCSIPINGESNDESDKKETQATPVAQILLRSLMSVQRERGSKETIKRTHYKAR